MDTSTINFPEWGISVTLKQNYDIVNEIFQYCSSRCTSNFRKTIPKEFKSHIFKYADGTSAIGLSWENTDILNKEYDLAIEISKQLILLRNFGWLHGDDKKAHKVDSKMFSFLSGRHCYTMLCNGTIAFGCCEVFNNPISFTQYYGVKIVDRIQWSRALKKYYADSTSLSRLNWAYDHSSVIYTTQNMEVQLKQNVDFGTFDYYQWDRLYTFHCENIVAKNITELICEHLSDKNKSSVYKRIRKAQYDMAAQSIDDCATYMLNGIAAIIISEQDFDFEIMHYTGGYPAQKDFIDRVKTAQNKPGYVKTIIINYHTQC